MEKNVDDVFDFFLESWFERNHLEIDNDQEEEIQVDSDCFSCSIHI